MSYKGLPLYVKMFIVRARDSSHAFRSEMRASIENIPPPNPFIEENLYTYIDYISVEKMTS